MRAHRHHTIGNPNEKNQEATDEKTKKMRQTATLTSKSPSMTPITLRVESDLKHNADALFDALGLDTSTAINLFLWQAIRKGGLPFKVKLDKEERKRLLVWTSNSARTKAKVHVDDHEDQDDGVD